MGRNALRIMNMKLRRMIDGMYDINELEQAISDFQPIHFVSMNS
jgi:hypothetical protein